MFICVQCPLLTPLKPFSLLNGILCKSVTEIPIYFRAGGMQESFIDINVMFLRL
jgi:hypothetical protein